MDQPIRFRGRVRHWKEDPPGGLAVVDIPADLVEQLGGRRQWKVTGSLNGSPFSGSTMLVAGGGFCVGVSKAALKAVSAEVGDELDVELHRVKTRQRDGVSARTVGSRARSTTPA